MRDAAEAPRCEWRVRVRVSSRVLRSSLFVERRGAPNALAHELDLRASDAFERLLEFVGAAATAPGTRAVWFGDVLRGTLVETATEFYEFIRISRLDLEVVHIVGALPTIDEIQHNLPHSSNEAIMRELVRLDTYALPKPRMQRLLLQALKRCQPERLKSLMKQHV